MFFQIDKISTANHDLVMIDMKFDLLPRIFSSQRLTLCVVRKNMFIVSQSLKFSQKRCVVIVNKKKPSLFQK